jgi:hypothetical protein
MLKNTMTSGLILGIVLVVFSLIIFLMGINIIKPPFWASLLQYLIFIVGIVYGTKKFRDENLGGEISYSKAFSFGLLSCVFAAIIYGIYMIIHMNFIDTNYLSKFMSAMEEEYLKAGFSEEQTDMAMSMVGKMMKSPIMMSFIMVISFAFMGTIFSLVTAAFLKKEKPIFQNPSEQKPE